MQKLSKEVQSILLNEEDFRTILRALKVLAVEVVDEDPADAEDIHNLRCHLQITTDF
jgi:hypothetical protein